jgi:hypothetical protein
MKNLIIYVAGAPAIYLTAASWHHEGEDPDRTMVFKNDAGEVVAEIPAEFFLGVVLESASRQAKPGFAGGA